MESFDTALEEAWLRSDLPAEARETFEVAFRLAVEYVESAGYPRGTGLPVWVPSLDRERTCPGSSDPVDAQHVLCRRCGRLLHVLASSHRPSCSLALLDGRLVPGEDAVVEAAFYRAHGEQAPATREVQPGPTKGEALEAFILSIEPGEAKEFVVTEGPRDNAKPRIYIAAQRVGARVSISKVGQARLLVRRLL